MHSVTARAIACSCERGGRSLPYARNAGGEWIEAMS
jgi:hypothetical protein